MATKAITFSELPDGAEFSFSHDPLRERVVKQGAGYLCQGILVQPYSYLGAAGFGPLKVRVAKGSK